MRIPVSDKQAGERVAIWGPYLTILTIILLSAYKTEDVLETLKSVSALIVAMTAILLSLLTQLNAKHLQQNEWKDRIEREDAKNEQYAKRVNSAIKIEIEQIASIAHNLMHIASFPDRNCNELMQWEWADIERPVFDAVKDRITELDEQTISAIAKNDAYFRKALTDLQSAKRMWKHGVIDSEFTTNLGLAASGIFFEAARYHSALTKGEHIEDGGAAAKYFENFGLFNDAPLNTDIFKEK